METVLFKNNLIKIGNFCLKPDDSQFHREGYVKNPLIVFPRNSIWIKHQGKRAFVADSTLINLYNKKQVYNRYAIDTKGDFCHWIEVSEELLQQIQKPGSNKIFNTEHLNCNLKIYLLQQELLKYTYLENANISLKIEELVINIICNLTTSMNSRHHISVKKQVHKKLVEKIKNTIHLNIGHNQSLSEIANIVCSSPFHISRIFREITGMGIHQYRTKTKLRSIYSEIQKGNQDLAGLAFDFGFSSHSHLSYRFKKYFGITPSSLL